MREIVRRIEREAGVPNLGEILAERIKPTDMQSLLLQVYKDRVKRRSPREVLSDYASNRFTPPSLCNPALLLEWDRVVFAHLPEGFDAIELSPVCPLGTVSCMSPISQDWVLTTIRNMEVVADPTAVLALECALRRRELVRSEPNNAAPVHLACSHRVVRTQQYRSPDAQQNFRVFSLCSAGRNTKSLRFNPHTAAQHIQIYLRSLKAFLGPDVPLRVSIIDLSPDSGQEPSLHAALEDLKRDFSDIAVGLEKAKPKKQYYKELRFKIYATPTGRREMELVDGGGTDWTHRLLNNAKERLVTSGIGSERLCQESKPAPRSSPRDT